MYVSAADIGKVDIFKDIDEFALKFLMRNTQIIQVDKDKDILVRGVHSAACYFLLDGIAHIRNNGWKNGQFIARHQAFRSVGESLGVTAALAYHAQDWNKRNHTLDTVDILRSDYDRKMAAGLNTSHTLAHVPCRLLKCDSETLLTVIQISPLLVSRIARAMSLRMQQDTLLQKHAQAISAGRLPLLAQFYFQWHLSLTAYRERGSGATYEAHQWSKTELDNLLDISGKDITAMWKLLTLDEAAYQVMVKAGTSSSGASMEDRLQSAAMKWLTSKKTPAKQGQGDLVVNDMSRLLEWCTSEDSEAFVKALNGEV